MADVKVEEICLCTLVHFLAHPPPTCSTSGVPFNTQKSMRDISKFLLRELKVDGIDFTRPLAAWRMRWGMPWGICYMGESDTPTY